MAKLFVRRAPDGSYNLRAERKSGKVLAGNVTRKGIAREHIRAEGEKLMQAIVTPARTPEEV